MKKRTCGLLTLFLLTAHCSLLTGFSWACPMCKEALVERAAKGYAVSIAALIGMPFLLVGGVAALIVRGHRRAR